MLLLLQAAAVGLSYVDSQANPMCSPSTSAFFSARDEASSLQDEYSQAASMATCESSSTLVSNSVAMHVGPGAATGMNCCLCVCGGLCSAGMLLH
jgi:hypothetical protein